MDMKERSLNKDEINLLFEFVRSKYVRFIDVQYEIVDHLATGIEEQLAKNENISFEQALSNEYAKFPITGFSNIIQEKSSSLSKYWQKRIFKYLLDFLTPPKLVISLVLMFLIYNISNFILIYILFPLIALVSFAVGIKIALKQRNKIYEKYLVLSSYYGSVIGIYNILFYVGLSIFYLDNPMVISSWGKAFFSFFVVIYIIYSQGILFNFPKMLQEELHQKYAHLKIA